MKAVMKAVIQAVMRAVINLCMNLRETEELVALAREKKAGANILLRNKIDV